MAVAWTDDAVGSGEAKLVVRQPVVAELATPRFLAPGDKAMATLGTTRRKCRTPTTKRAGTSR